MVNFTVYDNLTANQAVATKLGTVSVAGGAEKVEGFGYRVNKHQNYFCFVVTINLGMAYENL